MGIIDKIFSKFTSKEEQKKPKKEMDVESAMDLFFKKSSSNKKKALSDISNIEDKIETHIQNLMSAFKKLKNAKVEERRAKGSQRAKDVYVKRALEVLNPEFNSVEGLKKQLEEVSRLSNREKQHLKFFFKDEMKNIAQITSKIEELMQSITKKENESVLRTEKEVVSLREEIERMDEDMAGNKKELDEVNKKLNKIKKEKKGKHHKLNNIDLNKMDEIKQKIENLKDKKNEIFQSIDSSLGSVVRLLKKYQYTTGKSDELITEYSKNPHSAFVKDTDLKIKDYLSEACELADRNEIDIEDKKLSRCKDVLDNLDKLKDKAGEIAEINEDIESYTEDLNTRWEPLKVKKGDLENEIEMLDKELSHLEEKKSKILVEINRKKKKIPQLKKELAGKISSVLDVELKVV